MTRIRALLFATGLLWTLHSLWILFDPNAFTYVGFAITHWSTKTEVQTTFGLFTMTFGLFSLLGALRPERFLYSSVFLWALLYPAAAIGRFVAILRYGGTFALSHGLPESYPAIMLFVFEIPLSIAYLFAYRALRRDVAFLRTLEADVNEGGGRRKFALGLLFATGVIWIAHAGWIAVYPKGMEYTGYEIDSWTMLVHVATFYGTFETLLGVYAVVAALRPERHLQASLVLWTLIYSFLAGGRVLGITEWGDSFATWGVENFPASYNTGALLSLEGPSAVVFALTLALNWKRPVPMHAPDRAVLA